MRVLITGAAGFLGARVAREVLDTDLAVGGAPQTRVDELVLLDVVRPPDDLASRPEVEVRVGGLDDALADLASVDMVFHLAGVVSGAAEADFDLGMRTNLHGTIALLEWARGLRVPPVVVFSSSLAVFGADPGAPVPDPVRDDTLPRPQSSYGAQKLIGEQLVAEYTRRGFVRGRVLRLMTVSVRPGKSNAAASSFLSGIIREPLAGVRAVCPVPLDLPVAVSSPRRTVEGLLRAAGASDQEWGSTAAVTSPALTTTPGEMLEALDRVAGAGPSGLVDLAPDPAVAAIVAGWPARFESVRARSLGLQAPETFDEIVAEHLQDVAKG